MNLLFICSRNRRRSPTAEAVFAEYEMEVESAGLERDAEVPLCSESVVWADLIFVMEPVHRRRLNQQFGPWLKGRRFASISQIATPIWTRPSLNC